ncbi:MAG: TIGR03435 family protein [Verrucomicrobiae bacterium]|nr:TIGR03435 family protein [Verrucomicrobiae bacterium]
MSELDDHQLLAEFARDNSEAAFAALVQRHVNLVYSTALRSIGNAHAAEEITQAVFIILARKAQGFSRKIMLSGWLYQTARLTAANFLRGEMRRQQREQEAYMQSTLNEPGADAWPQIAPLLDGALEKLGAADRNAIVLRFLENKSLREVGAAMGASEDAAKMRVNRALEKLRKIFTKRGVTLTAVVIAGAVSTSSVQAAPAGLAAAIATVAITKGATAGSSTLALVKGALKVMAWTKIKMALTVGGCAVLAAGTASVLFAQTDKSGADDSWRSIIHFYSRPAMEADLADTPPQVTILPTIHPHWGSMWWSDKAGRRLGINSSVTNLLMDAYGVRTTHMIFPGPMAGGKYDFIANLPQGAEAAFRQRIQEQFGVAAHKQVVETGVWVLKAGDPEKLRTIISNKKSPHQELKYVDGKTIAVLEDEPVATLADALEGWLLRAPVVNRTGLSGRYDLNLKWDNHDQSKSVTDLVDQLHQAGLELVLSREKFEMLIVEKVK